MAAIIKLFITIPHFHPMLWIIVGGYSLRPLFYVDTINQRDFSIPALLVPLGGAVILLVISQYFHV